MSSPDLTARSPWSALTDTHSVIVSPPPRPILGRVRIPGSKSFTNRALIVAALARGTSELRGILRSDDSYWCVDALRRLGVALDVEGDRATVHGCDGQWPSRKGTLYIGAAGTIARFLPGTLAAARDGTWRLEASASLNKRPMAELLGALRGLGAKVECPVREGYYPLTVHGSGLHGGSISVSGSISSQYLSGLLIASALAKGPITITVPDGIVQHSYVQMTIDVMALFGTPVLTNERFDRFEVQPQRYRAQSLDLEADVSTSCYLFALAALSGGEVTVENLNPQTKQPDLGVLDILERMGCSVSRSAVGVTVRGPSGPLKGGFEINLREMSDQALTVAALAACADAPISIRGVAHIRHHESDRISAITTELRKLGAAVEEHDDGLSVSPAPLHAATVHTYDDHRIAMSLALLGTRVPGIEVLDPGCVSKTFPGFFDVIHELGLGVQHRTHAK